MRLTRTEVTVPYMDKYVVAILRQKQGGKCACGIELALGFQIAHNNYKEALTLEDIRLSCGACHALEHGFKSHTGTLRY